MTFKLKLIEYEPQIDIMEYKISKVLQIQIKWPALVKNSQEVDSLEAQ